LSRDGNNGTAVNESEQFLRRLQSASRISAVFNPWWESDSETDIGPAAPKIRRRQLAAYFAVRLGRAKIALGAKRLCQHRPRLPAQAARCLGYHRSRIACQYLHRVTRSVRDGLRLSCDPGARRDRRLQPRDDARRASPERADVRPLHPNDAGATNSKPTMGPHESLERVFPFPRMGKENQKGKRHSANATAIFASRPRATLCASVSSVVKIRKSPHPVNTYLSVSLTELLQWQQ
jgi:hypothetical protein